MNKKRRILFVIALTLLFTGIALATSSASSDIEIYAFDQNPAGSDKGNEWVTLYKPSNESVDIGNWTLETAEGERETIPEGTTLYPFAYYVYSPPYQWLDNSEEAITLRDTKGEEIDSTPVVSDSENDNRYWMRNNSEWIFGVKELEKGKIWSGVVKNVVDGDTVDVSFNIYGIQRIRLVGVNTPEIGEEGYEEAKEFVNKTCLGEAVKLNVDDKEQYDPYYRILAVVYVNDTNLNEKLLRDGYAEIMYIPPSEFNPYEWGADYTPNDSHGEGVVGANIAFALSIIAIVLSIALTPLFIDFICYRFIKPEIEIGYQKGSKKQIEHKGEKFTIVDTYLSVKNNENYTLSIEKIGFKYQEGLAVGSTFAWSGVKGLKDINMEEARATLLDEEISFEPKSRFLFPTSYHNQIGIPFGLKYGNIHPVNVTLYLTINPEDIPIPLNLFKLPLFFGSKKLKPIQRELLIDLSMD